MKIKQTLFADGKLLNVLDDYVNDNFEIDISSPNIKKILRSYFNFIFEAYCPESEKGKYKRSSGAEIINNLFKFNLFNYDNLLNKVDNKKIISGLLLEVYKGTRYSSVLKKMLSGKVYLRIDKSYSSFKLINKGWAQFEDFANEIKYNNRYFPAYLPANHILEELFRLKIFKFDIVKGGSYYRARKYEVINYFDKGDMGAPPKEKASAGRINPQYIRVLYLADSAETCKKEIGFDSVCVGRFVNAKKTYHLFDMEKLNSFSVYDLQKFKNKDIIIYYLLNHNVLRDIARAISEPIRDGEEYDYIPTQYLCMFIKSLGYDGVRYPSVMHTGGINYAFFDPEAIACEEILK